MKNKTRYASYENEKRDQCKLKRLSISNPLGKWSGREQNIIPVTNGGKRQVEDTIKLESIDAPHWMKIKTDARPRKQMPSPSRVKRLPLYRPYPVLNKLFENKIQSSQSKYLENPSSMITKVIHDPISHTFKTSTSSMKSRRFRQINENLNNNAPLYRAAYNVAEFSPEYSDEAYTRYYNTKKAHSNYLKDMEWCFHRKTTWNNFTSYSRKNCGVKDLLNEMHPLVSSQDIAVPAVRQQMGIQGRLRPNTTATPSMNRNRSSHPNKLFIKKTKYDNDCNNNNNNNNNCQDLTSSTSSDTSSSVDKKKDIKNRNYCSENTSSNSEYNTNNRVGKELYSSKFRIRGTPKQWSRFFGFGSGRHHHVKEMQDQLHEVKLRRQRNIVSETKTLQRNIDDFERRLLEQASSSVK